MHARMHSYQTGVFALAAVVFALPIAAQERSDSDSEIGKDFVGSFVGKVAWSSKSMIIGLQCDASIHCELNTSSAEKASNPQRSNARFDSVRHEPDLRQARLSLQYARRNRDQVPANEETAAMLAALKPLLESDTDIQRCIDLSGRDSSTLACQMVRSPWSQPTVLLLGLSLAECRQGPFCGYVIYPLHPDRAAFNAAFLQEGPWPPAEVLPVITNQLKNSTKHFACGGLGILNSDRGTEEPVVIFFSNKSYEIVSLCGAACK